jgi:glucose-6-phosphate 1-dehydrogenase
MKEQAETGIRIEPDAQVTGAIAGERRPDPCSLVIFGATGDLTQRKLLPALYRLAENGSLPEGFRILAFARRPYSDDDYRAECREQVEQHEAPDFDPIVWSRLAQHIRYHQGGFDDAAAYKSLRSALEQEEQSGKTGGNRLFYLAAPPSNFPTILGHLKSAGLIHPFRAGDDPPWSRVVIEKPFGHDLASARDLNERVHECLHERQVYRIDHYLGKETVQNILVFRFGNSIFEPVWNRKYIDHVQITASEEVGVEGRAVYYDGEGVLRDMLQNHLLQLLSLCAMEAPGTFDADDIRDEKTKVLRALRPIAGREVPSHVVHGQYLGYHREEGVDEASRTPTYVALRTHVDNWRWQGVPFYLRTGKKLAERQTEVSIYFQKIPLCLFGTESDPTPIRPNVLTIRIQPDEGIQLRFTTKVPGEGLRVGDVTMDFQYARAFDHELPDAYERLLLDCMRGDATLFARKDEIEEAWRFVTPIVQQYEADSGAPLALYSPGTHGPPEGDELLSLDGRVWRETA